MTAIAERPLKDTFTSTGAKMFWHQEAMRNLRNGKGQPIVSHVMLTDLCAHSCAFCSVLTRAGDTLALPDVEAYLDILLGLGLKAVILSGGGNPILYRCPQTGARFDDAVAMIHGKGLEIGLITDGMPLKDYDGRRSWRTVSPETLDRLTWIRISMAGLDHKEREVYVPDIDPAKTTLGFSYVLHDIYHAPNEPNHGKVSTLYDLEKWGGNGEVEYGADRLPWIEEQIAHYVRLYKPRYVRLLPNCLESNLIAGRCEVLRGVAERIDPDVVFCQYKPPSPPRACFLGYPHPVLNSDSFVYPCDSVVLNKEADHKFAAQWRICHWKDIGRIYSEPVRSLIADPSKTCEGCVFSGTNALLDAVANGDMDITPSGEVPTHVNFV